MSQIRISQLPQANTVAGNTVLPVVQAGETQQATVDVLRAEIVGNAGNIIVDNITFRANTAVDGDESQILSVANSSGDGNGYTTLQLIPDAGLVANDQYLIVDPTAPTHIHIRAGGNIDASSAELYLGGEENYVRVQDNNGIRLQNRTRNNTFYNFVAPTDFNTATWFGTPGNYFVQYTAVSPEIGDLAFTFGDDDDNRVTVLLDNEESWTLSYGGSSSNLGGGVYRFAVVEAPPASPSTIVAMDFEIWTSRTNSVELSSNDFTVSVDDDIRITGNDTFSLRNRSATDSITIRTDYDGADHVWDFGANGVLVMPGATVQGTHFAVNDDSSVSPLDITRAVQKLANGEYSLADGAEGQIMYFVPQTGATPSGVGVRIANARVVTDSNSEVRENNLFLPFSGSVASRLNNVVTLIFTDGAWNLSTGEWD
jgi:hypothetical protein